jgi:hypothetical protein
MFTIPGAEVGSGWHYIAARAYDVAGNVTDSPLTPVQLLFSIDLQDTFVTIQHHNGIPHSILSLPDSSFRATAYWMRFHTPRDCEFDNLHIWLGGSISDSSSAVVGVWRGSGLPVSALLTDTLGADDVNGEVTRRLFDFDDTELDGDRDYFIVANLLHWQAGDTLRIAADDGMPTWKMCGSRDDDGWHLLAERYGTPANLMMSCELYFAIIVPDTSGGGDGG